MSVPEVLVHRDASLLAKAVAARLVTRLVDAVAARGTASVVLTGGGIGTAVLAEELRRLDPDDVYAETLAFLGTMAPAESEADA